MAASLGAARQASALPCPRVPSLSASCCSQDGSGTAAVKDGSGTQAQGPFAGTRVCRSGACLTCGAASGELPAAMRDAGKPFQTLFCLLHKRGACLPAGPCDSASIKDAASRQAAPAQPRRAGGEGGGVGGAHFLATAGPGQSFLALDRAEE